MKYQSLWMNIEAPEAFEEAHTRLNRTGALIRHMSWGGNATRVSRHVTGLDMSSFENLCFNATKLRMRSRQSALQTSRANSIQINQDDYPRQPRKGRS